MIDAEQIAKEAIQNHIANNLDFDNMRITINKKQLAEMTGVSRSTLEQQFLCRQSVKQIEAACGTKCLWFYPEIKTEWRKFVTEQYLIKNGTYPLHEIERKEVS